MNYKAIKLPVIKNHNNDKVGLKTINDLLKKLQGSLVKSTASISTNVNSTKHLNSMLSQLQYTGTGRNDTLLLTLSTSNNNCCNKSGLCAEFSSKFNIDAMIKEVNGPEIKTLNLMSSKQAKKYKSKY
jgi:hypothetical protein